MKVILLENVIGLGRAGEIKTVKDGYARNYLIPQKMAEIATHKKQNAIERMQAVLQEKAKQILATSMEKKEAIEKEVITIRKKAGDEGKLFGSVTNSDIAEILVGLGYEVDKRKIVFDHIKELGEYFAHVRLDEGVTAEVKVLVVNENASNEPAPVSAEIEQPEPAQVEETEEKAVEEEEEEIVSEDDSDEDAFEEDETDEDDELE